MKYINLLLVFLLVSCGGGGGGGGAAPAPVAFALTLAAGIFSTNEDTDLNGSIAASANESVTLTYAITSRCIIWCFNTQRGWVNQVCPE